MLLVPDYISAVLAQTQPDGSIRPIAYASRTLQQHEQNYGVTELETLGVVWAVRHFRYYLYGNRCDVYTDHEALKALLNILHPSGKLARWGLFLQELDIHIHYRPGHKNSNADALARYPICTSEDTDGEVKEVVGLAVDVATAKGEEASRTALQEADKTLQEIRNYLNDGMLPKDESAACKLVMEQTQYRGVHLALWRSWQPFPKLW